MDGAVCVSDWRREWQPAPVLLPGESQGRGAWGAAVYGVAQSRTRLKRLSSGSMCIYCIYTVYVWIYTLSLYIYIYVCVCVCIYIYTHSLSVYICICIYIHSVLLSQFVPLSLPLLRPHVPSLHLCFIPVPHLKKFLQCDLLGQWQGLSLLTSRYVRRDLWTKRREISICGKCRGRKHTWRRKSHKRTSMCQILGSKLLWKHQEHC